MPRTEAQQAAAIRDGSWCCWSKYGDHEPSLIPATDVHHIFRRQPGADLPQLCISLGFEVHRAHHNGFSPTTGELIDLMLMLYGFDLRQDFPAFAGTR